MSKDFLAQGLGNIAGSFFQAMPAGGSLSRTGINVEGGGRTRWAGVYSGASSCVGPCPFWKLLRVDPDVRPLRLLIFIGFGIMIREGRELAVAWQISRLNTAAAFLTIVIAATVDLTAAIFAGIAFSLLTYAIVSSKQFRIVRMIKRSDGRWEDSPLPETMPSNEGVVIEVRGTVFFASVYMFDELLPSSEHTKNSVAILRARDRQIESLTALKWIVKYAAKLQASGNKLMLVDVEKETFEKLASCGALDELGRENVFMAQPTIHASIEEALAAAEGWIAAPKTGGSTDQDPE
jgi:SulP family sulfate permease